MDGLDSLKISEEKKKYIAELLNPVLEEMVAQCISEMPEHPMKFMVDWLEVKRVDEEDRKLSPEEKKQLQCQIEDTTAKLQKVKGQMHEAAQMTAAVKKSGPGDEEEEEEEDESDDEMPEDFLRSEQQLNKCRQSVSAEAYGEWNLKKSFVAPIITKSDEQKERLKNVLGRSFLFSNLDAHAFTIVIGAMKEVRTTPNQRVITQGDAGDFLFVIESGKLNCVIKTGDTEKVVKTCGSGDVFGELAVLYNCARAASVDVVEEGTLWQLDRDTFNHIVKDAAARKRERYDTILAAVPILARSDAYERSQIADALKSKTFSDGTDIVKQGERGSKFYIVEEGEAVALKGGVQVMSYSSGDYFGELALLRDEPRAATVRARGQCKLLELEKSAFNRLLDVSDILERAEKYK